MTLQAEIANMIQLVDYFMESTNKNAWLVNDDAKIYVRRSIRVHPVTRVFMTCFDVANVIVAKPGRGYFSLLISELKNHLTKYQCDAILMESVNNPSLMIWALRNGFEQYQDVSLNNFLHYLRLTSKKEKK